MAKDIKNPNINLNLNLNVNDRRTPFILAGIATGLNNANTIFDKEIPPSQYQEADYAIRSGRVPPSQQKIDEEEASRKKHDFLMTEALDKRKKVHEEVDKPLHPFIQAKKDREAEELQKQKDGLEKAINNAKKQPEIYDTYAEDEPVREDK